MTRRRKSGGSRKLMRGWMLLGAGALVVAVAVGAILTAVLSQGESPSPDLAVLSASTHALGPADAPVKVVEFGDFQ